VLGVFFFGISLEPVPAEIPLWNSLYYGHPAFPPHSLVLDLISSSAKSSFGLAVAYAVFFSFRGLALV